MLAADEGIKLQRGIKEINKKIEITGIIITISFMISSFIIIIIGFILEVFVGLLLRGVAATWISLDFLLLAN
jgi:hypothetical protein